MSNCIKSIFSNLQCPAPPHERDTTKNPARLSRVLHRDVIQNFVGVPGFEPGTSNSRSWRANRTALHPVLSNRCTKVINFPIAAIFFAKNLHTFCNSPTDSPDSFHTLPIPHINVWVSSAFHRPPLTRIFAIRMTGHNGRRHCNRFKKSRNGRIEIHPSAGHWMHKSQPTRM